MKTATNTVLLLILAAVFLVLAPLASANDDPVASSVVFKPRMEQKDDPQARRNMRSGGVDQPNGDRGTTTNSERDAGAGARELNASKEKQGPTTPAPVALTSAAQTSNKITSRIGRKRFRVGRRVRLGN
jgi:hypothetical protein